MIIRAISLLVFGRKSKITALVISLVISLQVLGQSGGPYELTWNTIDGGGGQSSGGPYVLAGTTGQPDADWSTGDGYELLGGFWPGGPLCFVAFDDFARFADYWLAGDITGDLDNSGELDFADVEWFSAFWLEYCPHGWKLK